jgi:hypothetical protein
MNIIEIPFGEKGILSVTAKAQKLFILILKKSII